MCNLSRLIKYQLIKNDLLGACSESKIQRFTSWRQITWLRKPGSVYLKEKEQLQRFFSEIRGSAEGLIVL